MRVLVLSCVFPPEPVVSAQTSFTIAKELVSSGHDVKVVSSIPSRPAGKIYSNYQWIFYKEENHPDGFKIVRCFSWPSKKSSLISRFLENIVFGISSALYIIISDPPDVIYSNTWPIFASELMHLVSSIKKIPYIVSIQDVYPESLTSQGRTKNHGVLFDIVRRIDKKIAKGASRIIVISKSFAEIYVKDREINPNLVHIIPNWVDENSDRLEENVVLDVRKKFDISPDSFLAVFGGNISFSAGVETFIKAFSYFDTPIHGLIAGEGSQLEICRDLAKQVAPYDISFYTPWPVQHTSSLYKSADVLVLPTRGNQSMASVPSKLIRYMLSGKPVIAASLPGSDLDTVIKEAGCGWVVPPDDPVALANAIERARELSVKDRNDLGILGRKYALEHLTMEACLPKVIDIIECVGGEHINVPGSQNGTM